MVVDVDVDEVVEVVVVDVVVDVDVVVVAGVLVELDTADPDAAPSDPSPPQAVI